MKKTYEIDTEDPYFDDEEYLKFLLMENVVFINNGWWYAKEGLPWQDDAISIHVGCNDVFAWGCADSEDLKHGEMKELVEMYVKDPIWGAAAWCIKKRKCMPQKPVEDAIRKAGVWKLEELLKV